MSKKTAIKYRSLEELRKAVEVVYGHSLREVTWEILQPETKPPYTESDRDWILGGMADYKRSDE